jgi:hypothetical protein
VSGAHKGAGVGAEASLPCRSLSGHPSRLGNNPILLSGPNILYIFEEGDASTHLHLLLLLLSHPAGRRPATARAIEGL